MNDAFIWISTHWPLLGAILGGLGIGYKAKATLDDNTSRINKLETKVKDYDVLSKDHKDLEQEVKDLEQDYKKITSKLDQINEKLNDEFRKFESRLSGIEALIRNNVK